jgi:hypothetical protein
MARTIRALLQTTIPFREDDWHVGRFSLLRKHLASLPGVEVTVRDRMPSRDGDDPVLSRLDDSFHHFADYNWSIAAGCPSFVSERAGNGYRREPEALADARAYVQNITYWLAQPHGGNEVTADGG